MVLPSIPTPRVVVDLARLKKNIAAMQSIAAAAGVRLRPHAKTHKSPVIARWQIEAGACGIACAKLGEAEVFADAGIADIRLPYPVHPSNAARVLALQDLGDRLLVHEPPDGTHQAALANASSAGPSVRQPSSSSSSPPVIE